MLQKTILAFGHFDLEGGRSWVIRTGLAACGYHIEIRRTEAKGVMGKYRDLLRQWRSLPQRPDAVYVPFLGHWILPLAWWLARRQRIPIVFDAFVSVYDSMVWDRKKMRRWGIGACLMWCTDWLCCRLCTILLLDTEEHAEYFTQTFGVSRAKILVLPIGCRTDVFSSTPGPSSTGGGENTNTQMIKPPSSLEGRVGDGGIFSIEFHGTFIPLQGIETILRAAKILQNQKSNVHFTLIGKGQTEPVMQKLAQELGLKNTTFFGQVPITDLPRMINDADVCLGIFGTTAKAGRVIPNKAYEVLSMGKALITAKTEASMRVLQDGQNALLIPSGDPQALADAILRLQKNTSLRTMIAANGRKLSEEKFQPETIVEPLVNWLSTQGFGSSH